MSDKWDEKAHEIFEDCRYSDDSMEGVLAQALRTVAKEEYRRGVEDGKKTHRDGKSCAAIIYCGPGHQSRATCDILGPHKQHANEAHGFYWSKKKAFTGYFDESPEKKALGGPGGE